MYEHASTLTNPGTAGADASVVTAVLLPGTVGNGVARRKVIGTGSNGLPIVLDLKGDILPPAGTRRYSVARISITVNETVASASEWGPAPVAASTMSLNIPFGDTGVLSMTFADTAERIRSHICWQLQYLRGDDFTVTAATGEAALFSQIVAEAAFASALAQIADGVR